MKSMKHDVITIEEKLMGIRSAVKTIVINEGKILLIKYITDNGFVYYELPGGGQELYEEMEDTAKREFFEETGFRIHINRFAALAEEIFVDEELRLKFPDYVHRIHHIFQGELLSPICESVINFDLHQIGYEWIPIEDVCDLYLIPKQLKLNLHKILQTDYPVYLGTVYETLEFK